MHSIQTQALILSLAIVCAVAAADMLAASTLPSLMSKPDVSIQVLPLGSVFSSDEGNTTVDNFDTEAFVATSANTKEPTYGLDEQPKYCPDEHDTLMCRDCGGHIYFFYEEHDYYDARCKGVGDDEHLKDCSCLEKEETEEDCIGCKRLGDDPDAWHRETAEAFARLPNLTSDSFADTKSTSVDQPYIDLDDDLWADVEDSVGQSKVITCDPNSGFTYGTAFPGMHL